MATPFSAIDDAPSIDSFGLHEDDLASVHQELCDISPNWYLLGLQLGIKPSELDKIEAKNSHQVDRSLIDMLKRWLQTADQPTWKSIVETLRAPVIDRPVVADKIEKKYCCPKRSLSDSATAPRNPTPLLTNQSSASILSPSIVPAAASHSLVSHQHLAMVPQSPELGSNSIKESGSSQPSMLEFPFLDVKNERLLSRLRREYQDIASEYAQLTTDVIKSLINREEPVKVEELLAILTQYPATQTHVCEKPKLFEFRSELCNAPNINKVFIALKDHHSFLCYKIIAYIVKNLGTDGDKRKLEHYECQLTKFCQRSIFECPAREYSTASPNLVMKVDQSLMNLYTMESIRDFQKDVERMLNISELQLCTVEKGCLKLSYHIPLFMQDVVFPLSSEQEKMLREIGVKGLTCLGKYQFGVMQELPETSEQQQQSIADIDHHIMSSNQKQDNNLKSKLSAKPDPYLSGHPASGVSRVLVKKQEWYTSSRSNPKQKRTRSCAKYMLLGPEYCPDEEECLYNHDHHNESPSIGYIRHPVGRLPDYNQAVGYIGYAPSGKVFITDRSDRDPDKELKIFALDDETLDYAKKDVLKILNRSHTVHDIYIIRCFIHPEAVDTANFAIKLKPVYSRSFPGPQKSHVAVCAKAAVSKTEEITVETFSHLNVEEVSSVYEMLENPEQTRNQQTSHFCSARVRITRDYIMQIEKQLMDALRWIHSKHFLPKLEGRFGKCHWTKLARSNILDSDIVPLSTFVKFLFNRNYNYKRYFVTEVKENSLILLEKGCLENSGSFVETFDIKLSVLNKGKLDLRIKFTDGKPEVVSVKVDEQKVITFDILCLHRQHDLRFSLNRYEELPPTDPFVEKFMSTLHMPQPGVLSFIPNGTDKEWSLRLLRHKKRRAFFCRGYDKKYMVTFTTVGDYTLPESDHIGERVNVQPSDYKEHTEAELHNLYWECAFAGRPPESALALLIEPHMIPAEVMARAPEKWTPEMIIKEFDIIQMLEKLNAAMDD